MDSRESTRCTPDFVLLALPGPTYGESALQLGLRSAILFAEDDAIGLMRGPTGHFPSWLAVLSLRVVIGSPKVLLEDDSGKAYGKAALSLMRMSRRLHGVFHKYLASDFHEDR